MPYDPDKHHRRSIRLKNYDYSQAGAYFVTVVVQGRDLLFGEIVGAEMHPNAAGQAVERWWEEIARKYPTLEKDEFVVMPNHFHGIIRIAGGGGAPTLGQVMDWLKTMTTNEYIRGAKGKGWPRFQGRLWQRNYHEHVIRDEDELNRIREYIVYNLRQWAFDRENPDGVPPEQVEPWEV
jgi:REP element-mobilizing transposase RayT